MLSTLHKILGTPIHSGSICGSASVRHTRIGLRPRCCTGGSANAVTRRQGLDPACLREHAAPAGRGGSAGVFRDCTGRSAAGRLEYHDQSRLLCWGLDLVLDLPYSTSRKHRRHIGDLFSGAFGVQPDHIMFIRASIGFKQLRRRIVIARSVPRKII